MSNGLDSIKTAVMTLCTRADVARLTRWYGHRGTVLEEALGKLDEAAEEYLRLRRGGLTPRPPLPQEGSGEGEAEGASR